jgi:NAD(P)-dependent dehydrogenase (short-subunit alcohol dehydrogenase family)
MRERGWHVIATARKSEDLLRLKNFEGVEAFQLELADPQSIATCAIRSLEITRGRLDALFNNAAFGQPGAVEDLTPALLREQLEVNLVGVHDLTRRVIPAMRRNGRGRIVNCSSVLGMIVAPYRGVYCASKFALEALTTSLRLSRQGLSACALSSTPWRGC